MSKRKYFPSASHYWILEGEARYTLEHSGSEDPLLGERLEFKENLINDLVVRVGDVDLKISLLLEMEEKYEQERRKYLSAEISLEYSLLNDILEKNLLEMKESLDEFINRLRKKIPADHCHLFRKPKKILDIQSESFRKKYSRARAFLFPEIDEAKSNGKIKDSYFHSIADRLKTIGNPISEFRNRVLAHKFDEKRFTTHLSLEQYYKIRESFKNTLNAVAMVGTLSSNKWGMTRSRTEIARTKKWLTEGLMASAPFPN